MVATVAAAAPAQAAQTPAPESISGSGIVAATHYSISVNAGPFGQDPSGTLSVNGFFTFDATLTCVNEVGQDGVAVFRINDGPRAGQGFLTASQSADGVGPGAILYSGTLPTPPANCPPPGTPPPPALANQGGGGTVQGTLVHTGGPDHPLPFQQLTFPVPAPAGAVTQGSDGTLWFAEPGAGRIATAPDDESGTVTEYDVPQGGSVSAIAPDSTGACGSPSPAPTPSAMWTPPADSPPTPCPAERHRRRSPRAPTAARGSPNRVATRSPASTRPATSPPRRSRRRARTPPASPPPVTVRPGSPRAAPAAGPRHAVRCHRGVRSLHAVKPPDPDRRRRPLRCVVPGVRDRSSRPCRPVRRPHRVPPALRRGRRSDPGLRPRARRLCRRRLVQRARQRADRLHLGDRSRRSVHASGRSSG